MYQVGEDGLLTGPTVTPSVGLNPLGACFTAGGVLVVAEAQGGITNDGLGKASVSTYAPAEGGALRVVSPSVGSGRTASCWITLAPDGGGFYASNTDDGSIAS